MTNTHLQWLAGVAADPRISAVTCRVAAGLVALADDQGRVRSRMTTLSAACVIPTRRMVEHLKTLIELGYLQQQDMTRQGRFAVTIVPTGEDVVLDREKPYREVSGHVIAVRPANGALSIYIESADAMLKVVTDRASASKIAAQATGWTGRERTC